MVGLLSFSALFLGNTGGFDWTGCAPVSLILIALVLRPRILSDTPTESFFVRDSRGTLRSSSMAGRMTLAGG